MIGFLIRMAVTAAGLWLATLWVPGFSIEARSTLVLAALLLGFVNAVVRPVVVFMTLPITVLTLGLFLWVINAGMLGLVAALLDDFRIAGLGPALIASLVLGLTSWAASLVIGPRGRYDVMVVRRERE